MAGRDRQRWDATYRQRTHDPFPPPSPLLLQFTPPSALIEQQTGRAARALDMAGGLGQNALWLASQGYRVDLIDISRVALTLAQEEALRQGIRGVNFIQMDLDTGEPERDAYDVLCVFRFLDRRLFPALRAAVRPGGRLIYETFNTRYQPPQPFDPAHLLQVGELAGVFADWELLYLSEPRFISAVVALKPEESGNVSR
jgi:SAM-dependent methyltransferase